MKKWSHSQVAFWPPASDAVTHVLYWVEYHCEMYATWQFLMKFSSVQIMQAVVVIIATLPADQRRSALNTMLTQVVQQLQNSLGLDRRKSMGSSAPDMSKKEEQKAEQSNQTLALFDRLTVILRYADSASCTHLHLYGHEVSHLQGSLSPVMQHSAGYVYGQWCMYSHWQLKPQHSKACSYMKTPLEH